VPNNLSKSNFHIDTSIYSILAHSNIFVCICHMICIDRCIYMYLSLTHSPSHSYIHSTSLLTISQTRTRAPRHKHTHMYTQTHPNTQTHTYKHTHTPRAGGLRVRRQFLCYLWYSSSLCCCCGGGIVPSRVFCFGRRQELRLCMLE